GPLVQERSRLAQLPPTLTSSVSSRRAEEVAGCDRHRPGSFGRKARTVWSPPHGAHQGWTERKVHDGTPRRCPGGERRRPRDRAPERVAGPPPGEVQGRGP